MKIVRLTAIAASMALNAWLALALYSPPARHTHNPHPNTLAPRPVSFAWTQEKRGNTEPQPESRSLADPRDALEKMVVDGYPEWLIRSITAALVDWKYGIKELDIEAKSNRSSAFRARIKKAYADANAEGEALYLFASEQRIRVRYGDLPPERIAAVQALESKYREESDQVFADALGAVLSPSERDNYLRFNSLLARSIQEIVSVLDIDEATYDRLWRAAVDRGDQAHSLEPDAVDGYRHILGDERFLGVIWRIQNYVAAEDSFYRSLGFSPALRADLFTEAYRMMHAGRALKGAEQAKMFKQTYSAIISKAGFTPEQKAAFDQSHLGELSRGWGGWDQAAPPIR